MTHEEHVFVVDVMVTDLTQEMVGMNVKNWPTSVIIKHNVIAMICKYKGFHEGHHFISMGMEVHDIPERDMDCVLLGSVFIFSIIDDWEVIYPCLFAFSFSSSMLLLFNVF
jgi:hypothetical protein